MKCIKIISLIVFISVFAANTNAEIKNMDIICDIWPPYQIVENNHISGFSTKIINSPWVMWVREGNDHKFTSFKNLLEKKVGLVRGYSYTPELWGFVKKHNIYEEVPTDEQNFKKLNVGRLDFVAAELGNGFYIIKKLGIDKIIPLKSNPIKSDGLYIIFNKKNVSKSFVNKFSDELKKLKQDALYQFIYEEYF